jgi:hypothetical protein
MSLIQEALKRQQLEQEKAGSAAPPTSAAPEQNAKGTPPPPDSDAPQSPPTTPPDQPPEGEGESADDRKIPKMVLAVVLVLVLVGVAGWLIYYGISILGKSGEKAPKTPPGQVAPTSAAPTVITRVVATNAVISNTVISNAVISNVVVTNTVVTPPLAGTSVTQSVQATTNIPPATGTVAVASPPPPVQPPAPPVATITQTNIATPKVVVWPVISLRGIVGNKKNGSAILAGSTGKGTIVVVGEAIEGVRLVEIEKASIVLEYEGERRTLRVGEKTQ